MASRGCQRGECTVKKQISVLTALLTAAAFAVTGCGAAGDNAAPSASSKAASQEVPEETEHLEAESTEAENTGSEAVSEEEKEGSGASAVRVGSLKGPTSMGLAYLMETAKNGETANTYEFTMAGKADELVGNIANGSLDIALVPANVASVLYNKTQGQVKVIDINTLGVLYVVASDDSISTMEDLKGKTVYMTGKGTTPEFAMNYLLAENGLGSGDVTMEFKSEAAEVASILKEDPSAIGVLPQPFASAACMQNPELKTVMDLTEQWDLLNKEGNSRMVTGVTIVRTGFLEEHEAAVERFLKDHAESAEYTSAEPEKAAQLVADIGIVEKAAMAQKAMPLCNIVCITGEEMKQALSGYLEVLSGQDAKSIGGTLPGDDFYYLP